MSGLSRKRLFVAAMFACVWAFALSARAADTAVQVQLDTKKASPRAVESLTERGILRDYRSAWTSIALALEVNTLDPLEGGFAGDAKQLLRDTVLGQQRSGLSQQYVNQSHKLETVFYAPEG